MVAVVLLKHQPKVRNSALMKVLVGLSGALSYLSVQETLPKRSLIAAGLLVGCGLAPLLYTLII